MELTNEQIEEIAGDLECGMRCFYNLKSGDIKTLPNYNNWPVIDDELWEEVNNEIDENWFDYFEFEALETRDVYQIMEDFAESVDDLKLQDKLINALNRKKPFQNFKWQIDNSGVYRQQWFDFKKNRFIEWVKKQIDDYNLSLKLKGKY